MTVQTKEADVPTNKLVKRIGLFGGIIAAVLVGIFADLGDPIIAKTAAVAVLMSIWWITEAIPLGATALLPLVLFPSLGIMDGKAVSKEFGSWVVFLFIGGFLIALAMERWNLHRRIALNILRVVGGNPTRVLLGFMLGTAFLSMWISNTATTMMMIPIAMAIMVKWDEVNAPSPNMVPTHSKFGTSLMLGTAYAASIGGMMTIVGTPPNTALVAQHSNLFPEAPVIDFARWMIFAVPFGIVMLSITWMYLAWLLKRETSKGAQLGREHILDELTKLPKISREEVSVLIVFVSVAVAWIFRKTLNLGFVEIPGWSSLLPQSSFLNDGTVAIGFAVLLFILPSRDGGKILEVDTFSKIPWGIVLLFGGGFALAAGFKESGLSGYIGEQLAGLGSLPLPLLIGIVCLVITFMTEVTSNTASAQILLPVLASLAIQLDLDPLMLMIPGALSCSCAFMLPVATPPNAIAFASGRIRMRDMIRTGILLNIMGVILITLFVVLLQRMVFPSG